VDNCAKLHRSGNGAMGSDLWKKVAVYQCTGNPSLDGVSAGIAGLAWRVW